MTFFSRRLPLVAALLTLLLCGARGQDSLHLSLRQAVSRGLDSSTRVALSAAAVREAVARYEQAKDHALPQIKVSYMASEAFIPTRTLQIPGLMKNPVRLPATSMVNLGTLSIEEPIFAGHKLRYAKESARLLEQVASLKDSSARNQVMLAVIHSYINLYEIDENLKITARNLADIEGRLQETQKFMNQGLATENDVLRFQLQRANVELTRIDLQHNRAVANEAMDVLLGFADSTVVAVDSPAREPAAAPSLDSLVAVALARRADLAAYRYQDSVSAIHIRDIKAGKLPTLGAGVTTYYLNPNKKFFPPAHSFLVPVTLGLNASWNISSLYTTSHKVAEAAVQREEVQLGRRATAEKIRREVTQGYHGYLQALQKIQVLHTAVAQATENDRIMELKYRNQLATTTDRIDAETMLYQSLVNLALAKADAALAWYTLQQATGGLSLSQLP